MIARTSAVALNHLLKQNGWASLRLAPFAGMTAKFEIAPFSMAYTILQDGSLRIADVSVQADALCVIPPSLLPRLALQDEMAQSEIRSEGDPGLLSEIFFLSRNLRWDAAEDLSGMTGDIAAERIVSTAQNVQQKLREASMNLSKAASEYLTEELPVLAKPRQISSFLQQVDVLRDDLARLELRIGRLLAANKH